MIRADGRDNLGGGASSERWEENVKGNGGADNVARLCRCNVLALNLFKACQRKCWLQQKC